MASNETRLLAQYHVTRALAEADSLQEAAPIVLRAICEPLEWEVGGLWLLDPKAEELRFSEFWCNSTVVAGPFLSASRNLTFARGVGLPGRVLASGRPAWITDVGADPDFKRGAVAAAAGLHAAFAFPVKLREKVLGVFDFFSSRTLPPDEVLLMVMEGVGSQIGQFDERRRAELALSQGLQELSRAHERLAIQHEGLRQAHEDLTNAQVALRAANERLTPRADAGEPTGLARIDLLHDRVGELVTEARTCSVVLLDLDHFSELNRGLGRRAGDRFLAEVVGVARAALRPGDALARYGGDELALLLPDTEAAEAGRLAEQLRQAIGALPCPLRRFTASVGVSTRRPGEELPQGVVAMAEQALAHAQLTGGDRVVHRPEARTAFLAL